MPKRRHRVFVSHASDDLWVAEQIAKSIEACGADAFLDRRDIAAGDNFKQRIREEIPRCNELLALFTPWSRRRAWVRHEIGMADTLGKRIVCVFYKVSIADFDADEDGRGPLDDLNFVDINALDTYLKAQTREVRDAKGILVPQPQRRQSRGRHRTRASQAANRAV